MIPLLGVAGFLTGSFGKIIAVIGSATALPLLANAFSIIVPKGFVYVRESRGRPSYKGVVVVKETGRPIKCARKQKHRLKRPDWNSIWAGLRRFRVKAVLTWLITPLPSRTEGISIRASLKDGTLVTRKVLRRHGPGVHLKVPYLWSGRMVDIRRRPYPMGNTTLKDGKGRAYQLELTLMYRRDPSRDGLARSEYSNEDPLQNTVADLWDMIIAATEAHAEKGMVSFKPILQKLLDDENDKGAIRRQHGIIVTGLRRAGSSLTGEQIQARGSVKAARILKKAWRDSKIDGQEQKGVAAKVLTQRTFR